MNSEQPPARGPGVTPRRADRPERAGKPAGWLDDHTEAAALGIIALGLVLRIVVAAATHLVPDDVLNLMSARQPALAAALRGVGAPPPLLPALLTRLLGGAGSPDFVLRLPALAAGTAALWFIFLWLRGAFGQRAALGGLLVAALAPGAIVQSTSVQGHALVLLFAAAVLYLLDRACRDESLPTMGLAGLVLVLAVLAHPSGVLFAFAFAVCAGVTMARRRTPARLVGVWAAGLAVTLLLAVLLRTGRSPGMMDEPLSAAAFVLGQDGLVPFVFGRTAGWFTHTFATPVGGWLAFVASTAGATLLLVRGMRARPSDEESIERGQVLLVPFVLCGLAALVGAFPYGTGSACPWLLVFAAGGIGALLAAAGGRHSGLALVAALVLLLAANIGSGGVVGALRGRGRRDITRAAGHVVAGTTPGQAVLTDGRTQVLMWRYLPGESKPPSVSQDGLLESRGGGRVFTSPHGRWVFLPDSFAGDLHRFVAAHGVPGGTRVTVLSAGRDESIADALLHRPGVEYPGAVRFGGNIAALPVPVAGNKVEELAIRAAALPGGPYVSVFWPTGLFTDSTVGLAASLAEEVIPYRTLYGMMSRRGDRKLYERLPALAFWAVGNLDSHPPFMRQMDKTENYIAGRWRFTLLEQDPFGVAAAFLVESPVGMRLDSLARFVATRLGGRAQAVLWPDVFLDEATRARARSLGGDVLSYSEFYGMIGGLETELEDYLPALAFWEFGNKARHPAFARRMDGARSFVSDESRFTLLAVDPDTVVGLYLIEAK